MKKALLKIGIIASLLFATALVKKESYHFFKYKNLFSLAESAKKSHAYNPLLALQTQEKFKTHFFGLKMINQSIQSLKEDFFLNAIYSHPFFVGARDSRSPSKENQIYESIDESGNAHFYLEHSNGVRHFSLKEVKVGDHLIHRLDNATQCYYPSLDSFISCTLG